MTRPRALGEQERSGGRGVGESFPRYEVPLGLPFQRVWASVAVCFCPNRG